MYLEIEIEGGHHVHSLGEALQEEQGEAVSSGHDFTSQTRTPSATPPALAWHQNPQGLLCWPLPVTFFSLR